MIVVFGHQGSIIDMHENNIHGIKYRAFFLYYIRPASIFVLSKTVENNPQNVWNAAMFPLNTGICISGTLIGMTSTAPRGAA